jgi:hypothetical protein
MLPVILSDGEKRGDFDIGGIRRGNVSGSVICPGLHLGMETSDGAYLRRCASALSGRPWVDVPNEADVYGASSICPFRPCEIRVFSNAWKDWSWPRFASETDVGCVWSRNTYAPSNESDPLHVLRDLAVTPTIMQRVRIVVTRPKGGRGKSTSYHTGINGFVADVVRGACELASDQRLRVVHIWLQGTVYDGQRSVSGDALASMVTAYAIEVSKAFLGQTVLNCVPRIAFTSPFAYMAMPSLTSIDKRSKQLVGILNAMEADMVRPSGAGAVRPDPVLDNYVQGLINVGEIAVVTLARWEAFTLVTHPLGQGIPAIDNTCFIGCGDFYVDEGIIRKHQVFRHLLSVNRPGLYVYDNYEAFVSEFLWVSDAIHESGPMGLGTSAVMTALPGHLSDLRNYRVLEALTSRPRLVRSSVFEGLRGNSEVPSVRGGVIGRPLSCIGQLVMSCASGVLLDSLISPTLSSNDDIMIAHVVPSVRVCRYGPSDYRPELGLEYYRYLRDAISLEGNVVYVCVSALFLMRIIPLAAVPMYECVYTPTTKGGFTCVSFVGSQMAADDPRAYYICVDALGREYSSSSMCGLGGSLALDHRNFLGIGRDVDSLMSLSDSNPRPSGHALGAMSMHVPHFLLYQFEVWFNLVSNSSIYDARLMVDEPTSGRYHSLGEYVAAVRFVEALIDQVTLPFGCTLRVNVKLYNAFLLWVEGHDLS